MGLERLNFFVLIIIFGLSIFSFTSCEYVDFLSRSSDESAISNDSNPTPESDIVLKTQPIDEGGLEVPCVFDPQKLQDYLDQIKDASGKVSLCHRTSAEKNSSIEISIGDPALKAHLEHGDYLGKCALDPAEEGIGYYNFCK